MDLAGGVWWVWVRYRGEVGIRDAQGCLRDDLILGLQEIPSSASVATVRVCQYVSCVPLQRLV